MYHGTSRKSWLQDETGLALHLTQDRGAALSYANESRENWLLDFNECDFPTGTFDAIVVEFTESVLASLVETGRVKLAPTQGCEELRGIKDWQQGFAQDGALRIEGFENGMKSRGVITAATSECS